MKKGIAKSIVQGMQVKRAMTNTTPKWRQQPFDFYCVLDFEATCDDGNLVGRNEQEVIEFPSVLVDVRPCALGSQPIVVAEFQRYIKPICVPKLTPFCTELTGITQAVVNGGVTFQEALDAHTRFLVEELRQQLHSAEERDEFPVTVLQELNIPKTAACGDASKQQPVSTNAQNANGMDYATAVNATATGSASYPSIANSSPLLLSTNRDDSDVNGKDVITDRSKFIQDKVCFVTCGDWDLRSMLPRQLQLTRKLTGADLSKKCKHLQTWLNIKHLYQSHTGKKGKGMVHMLDELNLKLDGRHHSGIDDCRNISKVFVALLCSGAIAQPTGTINLQFSAPKVSGVKKQQRGQSNPKPHDAAAKADQSKGAEANQGRGGKANQGRGGKTNQGRGGETNQGRGGKTNQGRGGKTNQGRGGKTNQGRGGKTNQGRGGKTNQGRGGETNQGRGGKTNQGRGGETNQGRGGKTTQGRGGKTNQGRGGKTNQGSGGSA